MISRCNRCHTRSYLFNHRAPLVAENRWEYAFWIGSRERECIGVAHTGGHNARQHFALTGGGNIKVHEVRILGHVASSVDWEPARPRIPFTRKSADAMATEAFHAWWAGVRGRVTHELREVDEGFVATYRQDGVDLLRVTIREHDLQVATTPLAGWAPLSEIPAADDRAQVIAPR